MRFKNYLPVLIWVLLSSWSGAQSLESFALSEVELLPGPFYRAQQTDMKYILEMDTDRLLAPFLIDAGLEPRAERYGNWEHTGLDGHIGGHYLSALAMMYAATGRAELRDRLEYMLGELKRCQEANGDGYIGGIPGGHDMWKEIAAGHIEAAGFSLNGKWVPLYNIHKLFAGLRDAFQIAGIPEARELLEELSSWLADTVSGLSDAQIQQMLISEHGGMNEVLADVYAMTGDKKYLLLAEKFSHQQILQPLLEQRDELTGLHANTQIPKVIGFERIAGFKEDKEWEEASRFFWKNVVEERSVSIGGNSVREHFHPVQDFSAMLESTQGPETCNTYNMLRLTKMLFLSRPDSKYIDYFEKALFNHILSSQHPDGGFVYFTPMRPRHYRVYSQPQEGFWCCVGSGLENHGKYGSLIYAHDQTDVYVNLFIASGLHWKEKGLRLVQETTFPEEEQTRITIHPENPSRFKIHIRKPGWADRGVFRVAVNGKPQRTSVSESGYITVERKWKKGDQLTVSLPMHTSASYLPAAGTGTSRWVSFVHGPIVLAAVTDTTELSGLLADDSRMGHVANGRLYPMDEAPMIVSEAGEDPSENIKPVAGNPMTFTAPELIYPEKYKKLQLVPFYTIHDARYMIYWPVTPENELKDKLTAIREKEEKFLALEARTTDQVATGEQQPETEHHFKGEKTDTGLHDGHFWRDAAGWFSYELNHGEKTGKTLRITYAGKDKDRNFSIFVNNRLLAQVRQDGTHGDDFYEKDYDIPEDILRDTETPEIEVKFSALNGTRTGRIYHVRLMTE